MSASSLADSSRKCLDASFIWRELAVLNSKIRFKVAVIIHPKLIDLISQPVD